ncbi:TonB-dependent receptor plug domain-containing protein [Chitinivibrio alkaliphilus]|uniref:TonB-dependent receptor n=1 Tax=Chitinivibrio alkaliphilus ACht1 TaxID=1313304 RepID=U7D404_9BACT|nr:TonB-dependent receptor [Chitinivibrio alkaliphilus]ERP31239.1 TonB-dependent receptor [Chitinivibrio alkaliphilus ACht1]
MNVILGMVCIIVFFRSASTAEVYCLGDVFVRDDVSISREVQGEKAMRIDSVFIAESGAATTEDLLHRVPGVSVRTYMGGQRLSINGLDGRYTKILVDGIALSGDVNGAFPIESIPLSEIAAVEIVRGPGSSLYGSDAVGGVINIITHDGQGVKPFSLGVSSGYETNIVSVKWDEPGFSDPDVSDRTRWGGVYTGDIRARYRGEQISVSAHGGLYKNFGALDTIAGRRFTRYLHSIGEETRLNHGGSISTQEGPLCFSELGYRLGTTERVYSATESEQITSWRRRRELIFRGNTLASDNLLFEGHLSVQRFETERERYNFDHERISDESHTKFPRINGQVQSVIFGEVVESTIGIEGTYEGVQDDGLDEGEQFGSAAALFGQSRIIPREAGALTLIPGIRFGYNSRFDNVIVPSFSSRLDFFSGFFARAALGKGYLAPSFQQNYRKDWVHTGGSFVLSGNPDLEPETSWGGNVSIGSETDRFSWEVYGHGTRVWDQIATQQISDEGGITDDGEFYRAVRAYVNLDSVQTYGGDISLSYTSEFNLMGSLTYSYLYSQFWDAEGVAREAELYSPHGVSASLSWSVPAGQVFSPVVSGSFVWQDEQIQDSESGSTIPSDFDINTQVHTGVGEHFSVSLGVRNLLDNTVRELNQTTGRTMWIQVGYEL